MKSRRCVIMLNKKKGQSILEYVIVLIAIVGCIAWFATKFIANTDKDAANPKGVGKLMQQTGTAITTATTEIGKIGQ